MYKIMFYVGLVLALFFLVISIVLFVRNNVAKLIGDVTGWNAKKAIKRIHAQNADSALKLEEETMVPVMVNNLEEEEETTLLAEEETTLLFDEEETTLLAGEETTMLVDDEETTLLMGDEETTLLTDEEETTLLATKPSVERADESAVTDVLLEEESYMEDFFQMEEDIVVTHTEERIGE